MDYPQLESIYFFILIPNVTRLVLVSFMEILLIILAQLVMVLAMDVLCRLPTASTVLPVTTDKLGQTRVEAVPQDTTETILLLSALSAQLAASPALLPQSALPASKLLELLTTCITTNALKCVLQQHTVT